MWKPTNRNYWRLGKNYQSYISLEAENTVEADARIENILELRSVIVEFEEKAAGSVLTDEEDEFREERDRLREDGFDVKEPTLLQSFLERIA